VIDAVEIGAFLSTTASLVNMSQASFSTTATTTCMYVLSLYHLATLQAAALAEALRCWLALRCCCVTVLSFLPDAVTLRRM
jgi:hypothetical protein